MALIRWKWRMILVNETIFLLAALPTNYLFPRYLLTFQRQPLFWWMMLAPLNLVALFASFEPTFWMAVEGLALTAVYCFIQLWQRQNKMQLV